MKKLLQTTVLVTCLSVASQASQITLTVNNQPNLGATIPSDQVSIGLNEVAEVKSLFGSGDNVSLNVIKNGITNSFQAGPLTSSAVTVVGPAVIQLVIGGAGGVLPSKFWFCTVKIEPESFPPDKTIIIPQGTPGANIIMEQSSDLIHWTNSVPGLYTNTAITSMFFRIRAERL